jgi:hypothetical protein
MPVGIRPETGDPCSLSLIRKNASNAVSVICFALIWQFIKMMKAFSSQTFITAKGVESVLGNVLPGVSV